MARNLQSKLSPGDNVRLFDTYQAASEKLAQEMKTQQAGGAQPQVAESAAAASSDAVRFRLLLSHIFTNFPGFHDEFVPRMIFSKLGHRCYAGVLSYDFQ